MCNHENRVLVSSGVDEHGEWRSMECEDCGKVWLERGNMKVNGYEVGQYPTDEEFATYRKVERFLSLEWLACMVDEGVLTQDEFELLEHRYSKLDFSIEECDAVEYELEQIISER